MNIHFLQSKEWEEFQRSNGQKTFRSRGKDYEFFAFLKKTPVGNYLFCPYGPAANTEDGLKNAIQELKKLAKQEKCVFIRIEPTHIFDSKLLSNLGLKKSQHIDPEHTWVLDLEPSIEDLTAKMIKNKTRAWRNYKNKGIVVESSQNPEKIDDLMQLLQKISEKDDFALQPREYLASQLKTGFATLYTAKMDGKTIASCMVYDDKTTRYYAQAAADTDFGKYEPGSILLIQAIADAKENGQKFFDFWGITTSEDKNHPWYGFTQYKKSFGGHQVDYCGTYDLATDKIKFAAYSALRPINRLKRKIQRKSK